MLWLQVIPRRENGLHGCCRLRVRQEQSHRINAGAQRGLPACLAAAFETADSTSRWSHSALQSSVAAGAADIRRSCLLCAAFCAWKSKGKMQNKHHTTADPIATGEISQKRLACAYLSQKLEHLHPSLSRNFGGRHGQRFAAPRAVRDADGGLVVEVQLRKLGVVQGAGDEVASDRDRDVFVAAL